ncbi:MAG: protein-methionine-sulfoxide reductase heme-binding subunit MsrQ [Alphaproteobacteria bacterium]
MNKRLIYIAVWLALLAPLPAVIVFGVTAFNPIEYIERNLGLWGLRFLIIGLVITPMARIFRRPTLIRYRRTAGLFAFTYVLLHWLSYIVLDLYFDWPVILKDIYKRPFITIGMAAFVALIPLAVTSTDALRRRLGPVIWERLHQLIYLIVPAGLVHYWLMVKADHRSQLAYGSIIIALLAWRITDKAQAAARRRARAAEKAARTAA